MKNPFKLRHSSLLCSSFCSCRSGSLSDVIENPAFVSQPQQKSTEPPPPPSPPKSVPFHAICRPDCRETKRAVQNSFITYREANILRQNRASVSNDPESTTPLNLDSAGRSNQSRRSRTTSRRRKVVYSKNRKKAEAYFALDAAPSSVLYNNGWETEDDDEEEDGTETLFSSRSATRSGSVSSDSSGEIYRRREGPIILGSGPGPLRGSVAVVKCSVDRYSDFRNSMVEMIVEKQVFAVEDLEQLLRCFLTINASEHHSTIVEVFVKICEALFSAGDRRPLF